MRTAHLQSNPLAGESKQVCAAHQSLKQMRVSKAGTRTEPSLEQGADLPTTYGFFKLAYACSICLQHMLAAYACRANPVDSVDLQLLSAPVILSRQALQLNHRWNLLAFFHGLSESE